MKIQLIAGEATPIRDFMTALASHKGSFNILLVDSEQPDNGDLIGEVRNRSHWKSDVARGVTDDQIQFMVQVMESWFLADPHALISYYGPGLREGRLPPNPAVEQIPKTDVLNGIESATRETTEGAYHKTRHGPDLLQRLDADKVRSAAPNCRRLFESLERAISEAV